MTIITAAHCEDPDGRIAQALILRYSNLSAIDPKNHLSVRYDRISDSFDELKKRIGQVEHPEVYVVDVNFNPKRVNTDQLVHSADAVTWLDHHQGTEKYHSQLKRAGVKVHYDAHLSAGPLVLKHLLVNADTYEKKLAQIAQAHDHKNIASSDHPNVIAGDDLEKIIALANSELDWTTLFNVSLALAEDTIFDANYQLTPVWKDKAKEFDQKKQAAFQKLNDSIIFRQIGDYQFVFGYAPAILSQKPGIRYLKQNTSADVMVCIFAPPVRNQIFDATSKEFKVVPFVESLGGGGRDNSGGYSTDYDVTEDTFGTEVNLLTDKIKKYLQI